MVKSTEEMSLETSPEKRSGPQNGNGQTRSPRIRVTAESMAAKQREISVSEFFAKNRHLLGFDNPRKALLTMVKEAVDNALDACEEAGVLPEIWVRIDPTGENRYRVIVQDNGPGIVKKQIPLIFGKLLYGSKFHRLRQSRGQQGIGISAAGMYGLLTTGKPVSIVSKTGPKKPAHFYQIQIDTKNNRPEIVNGRGEGIDIPPQEDIGQFLVPYGLPWSDVPHGTLVAIEIEAKFQRGRGSVDEYLYQTAIANPHVTIHYVDPEGKSRDFSRVADVLPPEPKEIKPHPYGVELGWLLTMLKDTKASTLSGFLVDSFSRISPAVAQRIAETAQLSTRANPRKISRHDAEALFRALQETKIQSPATDCLSPIGEELILKGLRELVPGEFYTAITRPPAVYRGNPFQVEVGLAYGGAPATYRVSLEVLEELLAETDARTLRQFLTTTFDGIGPEGADRIIHQARLKSRMSPAKLKAREREQLCQALQTVNLSEGQTMTILRYANRVPLLFQAGACAITQTVMSTNWRPYGLTQSRNALPSGPVTLMVHFASVWVPFTSESKEAIAAYPEIQRELRLAYQAVGRRLGLYLRRRLRVKQQGERRNIFLRYLKEVANAVAVIRNVDRESVYRDLMEVAKRVTAEADLKLDEHGNPIEETPSSEEFDGAVIIVEQQQGNPPLRSGNSKPIQLQLFEDNGENGEPSPQDEEAT
ncbi:MAG: DNA topoisomerase VI subunit B [Thermogutta sp.]|nr:DNA topoisomerase VI subunit B [Thermogutta sp.]HOP75863.1 DNA topoisomerase VI subunit B [Thermogutta sp.]HPU05082.1 DNA topoisomerase VI subunit B [Thermogutta sp.]